MKLWLLLLCAQPHLVAPPDFPLELIFYGIGRSRDGYRSVGQRVFGRQLDYCHGFVRRFRLLFPP